MFQSRRLLNPLARLHLGALALLSLNAPHLFAQDASLFQTEMWPIFEKYCVDCHSGEKAKADVDLTQFGTDTKLYEERSFWELVSELVVEREMPPDNKPQPTENERIALLTAIEAGLAELDCETDARPGRVTARRLNRNEYNNTIRDLMLVDLAPADGFPADEVGYGFDNIGDVLTLSPIQMERYLDAAVEITEAAIRTDIPSWPPEERHQGEDFISASDDVRPDRDRYLGLFREGEGWMRVEVEKPAVYRLRIRSFGDQAGPEAPRMSVSVNGDRVTEIDVPVTSDEPQIDEIEVTLPAGRPKIAVGYLNNFNSNGDRNLFVDYIDVIGPLDAPKPDIPASHAKWIPERPAPGTELRAARGILRRFATQAYRRPVTEQEVRDLSRFAEMALADGESFESAIQLAMQAGLTSPKFLFRWELDPDDASGLTRELDQYEIASRLSYFLWNSMPDAELFRAAAAGELSAPETLLAQSRRMIDDPRSAAFFSNFVGQWLQIRNLETHEPDPERFPDYDAALANDMRRETELFFESIARDDRSVLDILSANFTFINERLARHYGMPGIEGEQFRRISLPAGSPRRGALTHASIMTLTSNPTRTSPVIRGKWVLEQILGTPPPPPPPGVPELEEDEESVSSASLRQRLEIHRSKPDCRGCHDKMDPIGFAFENFDAIGRWRDLDGKFSIDPAGELPTGESFNGPADLLGILQGKETFLRSLTEKTLTYALGRGLEYYDQCAVDKIVDRLKLGEYRYSVLIEGILLSEPFLTTETKAGALANE